MEIRASERKDRIRGEVDRLAGDITRVSRSIHAHPELGLHESWACAFLSAEAAAAGFAVEAQAAGMETAFIARYSSGKAGPRVAFLCEYDALPDLGHGCGHNVIAAGSFGAALALRPVVDELGGEILLIGTPDEEAISAESKGGKVIMSRAGVFGGLDAVMMMHPIGGLNQVWRYSFPLKDFTVRFEGKPAHYTEPEKGVNALESLLLFLHSVNDMKRGWSPSVMFAYTITDGGGPSAITVPKSAEAHVTMKAFYGEYLESRFELVRSCARSISEMTGARGAVTVLDEYRHMIANLSLAASLAGSIRALGGSLQSPVDSQRSLERQTYPGISTDFGDVSWEAPAIHGYCGLGDDSLVAHTPEFAAAAGSAPGDAAALLSAKAMAMTAVDLLEDGAFARRVKDEYLAYRSGGFRGVPGIPPDYSPFPLDFIEAFGRPGP
ncbi:MAG: amidohydrolase [Spirochaetes bacterium]|nr:amidohydrolase [Spirochaetota bacterium]MBU1080294.1 amidohydrolase [Spirochaetota bacterium]